MSATVEKRGYKIVLTPKAGTWDYWEGTPIGPDGKEILDIPDSGYGKRGSFGAIAFFGTQKQVINKAEDYLRSVKRYKDFQASEPLVVEI